MANRPDVESGIGDRFDGTISAGWLFDGDRVTRGGGIRVRGGVVEALLDRDGARGESSIDFPTALVHPGLFNAHAHLDLSRAVAIDGTLPFTEWLESARSLRIDETAEFLRESAASGLSWLVASGTTGVIDFSFDGLSSEILAASPVESVVLREIIGLSGERAERAIAAAREWLAGDETSSIGIAPHAPYSAGPDVIRECKRLAGDRLFAIHVAEDRAEAPFLESGGGPFQTFLARLGIDLARFEPPGCRPIPYLDRLGVLDANSLLVHANDLRREEIATIARSGAAVAFCPGTHEHFQRPEHPLSTLLDAGARVALGTDSPASNTGLSMVSEMRATRRLFPGLSPDLVWRLGVGRQLDPSRGRIRVGELANFAIAELGSDASAEADPLEHVLRRATSNRLTIAGGVLLHRSGLR